MYLFNCPLQEGKGKVKNADLAELFWFSHWTAVAVLFPSLPQPTPSAIAVNTRSPQPWASTAQGEVASRARKSLCTFFPSWVPLFARSPQWDSLPISQLTSYFQLGMQFPCAQVYIRPTVFHCMDELSFIHPILFGWILRLFPSFY